MVMAGLFTLIFGAVLGGSAIKCGIENEHLKQHTYTLPNGIKYYYDRTGTTRLMDGTIICYQGDKWVDTKYNVICDNYAEREKKERTENKKSGNLTYFGFSKLCKQSAVFEVSTGKIIAKIQRSYDGTCRKWYFHDNHAEMYSYVKPEMRRFYGTGHPDPTDIKEGDEGIIISTEEFEQLKKERMSDWNRKEKCSFWDSFD